MNAPTATNIRRLGQTSAAKLSELLLGLRNDVDRLTKCATNLREDPEALRPVRGTVLEFRAIAREIESRLSLLGSPQPDQLEKDSLTESIRNHATSLRIAEHKDKIRDSLKEAGRVVAHTRELFQKAVSDVFYDSGLVNFLLTCVERQHDCAKQIQRVNEVIKKG